MQFYEGFTAPKRSYPVMLVIYTQPAITLPLELSVILQYPRWHWAMANGVEKSLAALH